MAPKDSRLSSIDLYRVCFLRDFVHSKPVAFLFEYDSMCHSALKAPSFQDISLSEKNDNP
jgi:hypothetical protein